MLQLQVWLQEFAWTEADKPIKLAARSSMVPNNADLARQPMFCFETMMKLLYWSCFVYDQKKVCANICKRSLHSCSNTPFPICLFTLSNPGSGLSIASLTSGVMHNCLCWQALISSFHIMMCAFFPKMQTHACSATLYHRSLHIMGKHHPKKLCAAVCTAI